MWRLASRKVRPTIALGLAMICPSGNAFFCEDKDNNNSNVWDAVLPKNADGSISWDKVSPGEGMYWDKVAKQAGMKVQGAMDSGIPASITYGFASGFCSGYALKKVGRVAAIVLGMGFMSLQALSYYGYIKVDHSQLERDFTVMADLNNDGKIDAEDGKIAFDKIVNVLQFNLPSGGGFVAGFVGGLRSG